MINASASGALVKLKEWINFANGEVVEVVLTSTNNNNSGKSNSIVMSGSGVIKRQLKIGRQVAIMFLSSADQD